MPWLTVPHHIADGLLARTAAKDPAAMLKRPDSRMRLSRRPASRPPRPPNHGPYLHSPRHAYRYPTQSQSALGMFLDVCQRLTLSFTHDSATSRHTTGRADFSTRAKVKVGREDWRERHFIRSHGRGHGDIRSGRCHGHLLAGLRGHGTLPTHGGPGPLILSLPPLFSVIFAPAESEMTGEGTTIGRWDVVRMVCSEGEGKGLVYTYRIVQPTPSSRRGCHRGGDVIL